ncbi:hypothetical protein M409DRAFT_65390 [Zasmidium cellare ATCC 36951]|uniref:FAD-binding domain-containing protein n=1 Tax=Zasmidium cellare ATCC 36951 TaxID=1080233 RepID=A0A6A6CQF7_ZASCE|nr:uncharacterized protein M409DRAFT_65390 [Zasmidium cellare ATCC 36951]KAF2168370.1 hypothetical protein M409DRAFT_65390 [Zasmidium cellare ATCC 36951]
MPAERLKIAIAGGGIASLCLAHSLTTKHPQWSVKIFEASPQIRDEGAAIGLATNAQEALGLISPSLREALDEAGGVPCVPAVRIMVGTGKNSGLHVGDVPQPTPQITVHRTAFWNALRQRIPDDVLQLGKKLASITSNNPNSNSEHHPITLTFTDSTTATVDALIGCDGINSTVRLHVLGPAYAPVYTQGYNHRVVVPLAEAEEAFGKEYCSLRTQYGWIGEGGFLLTDHCDQGRSMQVIAGWSDRGPWPYELPWVEWDRERLKRDLEDWGDVGRAMLKIFLRQPTLHAAAGRIHPPTPTYISPSGHICLAGDAAQSFPPFLGAGAGQAIEDALLLSTVLGLVETPEDIPRALGGYDGIRRPRRSAIAEASMRAARLMTGRDPDVGVDPERIRERLSVWKTEVFAVDLEGQQREARESHCAMKTLPW